jgi:hypothetical protein
MATVTQAIHTTFEQALRAAFGGNNCIVLPSGSQTAPRPAGPAAALATNPQASLRNLRLKGYGYFRRFAALPSAKSSRWLLPLGNASCTESASQLYTPYDLRDRVSKALLLGLIKIRSRIWGRGEAVVACREIPPLETLVSTVTGERHPIFALSLGAPGRCRNLTLQVMRASGRVLGYIKIPLTPQGAERIRFEAEFLKKLEKCDALRPHIPRVLSAGPWQDGYLLFQTAAPGEQGPAKFNGCHGKFLDALAGVHRVERPGQALVKEVADRWAACSSRLDANWQSLAACALRAAGEALDGRAIACGVSHGDFAPWNTRLYRNRLLVFDWEAASWEAPLCWDGFHFDVEVANRLHKKTREDALCYRTPSVRACFLLYLLHSICQDLEEGIEEFDGIHFRQRLLMERLGEEIANRN